MTLLRGKGYMHISELARMISSERKAIMKFDPRELDPIEDLFDKEDSDSDTDEISRGFKTISFPKRLKRMEKATEYFLEQDLLGDLVSVDDGEPSSHNSKKWNDRLIRVTKEDFPSMGDVATVRD
jgi:hypothetical protein